MRSSCSDFLALARGLLAQGQVLRDLALFAARLDEARRCARPAARRRGSRRSGRPRAAPSTHQRHEHQAGPGEAQPLHAQRARPGSRARRRRDRAAAASKRYSRDHSSAVLAHSSTARPIQKARRRAREPAGVGCGDGLAAHPARKRRQPGANGRGKTPPRRKAEQEIAGVGQPGAQAPAPVAHDGARARGGKSRVLRRVAQQREQPEDQGHEPSTSANSCAKRPTPARGDAAEPPELFRVLSE